MARMSRSNVSSLLRRAPSYAGVLFAVGATAAGCTTSSSTPVDGAIVDSGIGSAQGALTRGRVTTEGGASAGVMVRAYSMAPDGTTTPASEPTMTGTDGRYELRANLAIDATRLVVRVEDGTDRASSISTAAVRAAGTASISMAPIDVESTFVSDVAASVERDDGTVSGDASTATSLFVTTHLASRLSTAADRTAAVDATARAVVSARSTLEAGLSASSESAASLYTQAAEAELHLSASLDTTTDTQAALTTYFEESVEGAVDAGVDVDVLASSSLAARSALAANLDGRVDASDASLSTFAVFAVSESVNTEAGTALDSESRMNAASVELRDTMLELAATASTATSVRAAWASYDEALDASVAANLTVTGMLLADLTAAIDESLDTASTTLRSEWRDIGASGSASARVQAYSQVRADFMSSANTTLLTTNGLESTDASVALEAMAQIEAATL